MNIVLAILTILEIKSKRLSLCNLITSSNVKKETFVGLAGLVLVENKEETLMGLAQPLAALVENTLDQMIIT
jgi:hypothetical protein